jgi:Kinesin motor domain
MSQEEMAKGHQVVVELKKRSGEIFVNRPYAGEEPPKQFTFDSVFDWTSS